MIVHGAERLGSDPSGTPGSRRVSVAKYVLAQVVVSPARRALTRCCSSAMRQSTSDRASPTPLSRFRSARRFAHARSVAALPNTAAAFSTGAAGLRVRGGWFVAREGQGAVHHDVAGEEVAGALRRGVRGQLWVRERHRSPLVDRR